MIIRKLGIGIDSPLDVGLLNDLLDALLWPVDLDCPGNSPLLR